MTRDTAVEMLRSQHAFAVAAVETQARRLRDIAEAALRDGTPDAPGYAGRVAAALEAAQARRDALRLALDAAVAEG